MPFFKIMAKKKQLNITGLITRVKKQLKNEPPKINLDSVYNEWQHPKSYHKKLKKQK